MCLISPNSSTHVSPHGTLSFSQVHVCRTVRDGCSSLRYSNSEKRFRMPAALLYTKSSFPGNVSIMVSNQASLPVAILSAQYASRHHHVPCRCLELHLTARSCSCSCLPPCLKALDKLLISFEVRRHDAASCAIRHEYAGCRWLKTPPFGVCSN